MSNEEILYPELIDYIWNYCCFMKEDEQASWKHNRTYERLKHGKRIGIHKYQNQELDLSKEEHVLTLLSNGYEHFKVVIATRIYNEKKQELKLNLCPNCNKIARTPVAKQCRFCGNSWRKQVE